MRSTYLDFWQSSNMLVGSRTWGALERWYNFGTVLPLPPCIEVKREVLTSLDVVSLCVESSLRITIFKA